MVVHKYRDDTGWTLCGRYASTTEGNMASIATDIDYEVTCKSCKRIASSLVCGKWVGEIGECK